MPYFVGLDYWKYGQAEIMNIKNSEKLISDHQPQYITYSYITFQLGEYDYNVYFVTNIAFEYNHWRTRFFFL